MPSAAQDHAELVALLRRGMRLAEGQPFSLSSGAVSHVVFDAADAICDDSLRFVVNYLLSRVTVPFDAIGGPALGAGPLVYGVGALSGKRSFLVRSERKSHGAGGWFKGRFVPGDRILVVEDVVTSGESLLRAMEVIAAEGGTMVAAASLIDRGDSTAAAIRRAYGMPYYALTTHEDFGIESVVAAPTAGVRSEPLQADSLASPASGVPPSG
jgi:orotate phosphoribosyltransferase